MSIKKYLLAILFTSLILTGGSIAHEWYPAACCSGNDCRPVECSELVERGKGIAYRNFYFYDQMIKPSLDGQCHVCISNETTPEFIPVPHCVFIQQNS